MLNGPGIRGEMPAIMYGEDPTQGVELLMLACVLSVLVAIAFAPVLFGRAALYDRWAGLEALWELSINTTPDSMRSRIGSGRLKKFPSEVRSKPSLILPLT